MAEGVILKALSGFYYVYNSGEITTCRARGKFRKDDITPLVGDKVEITLLSDGGGVVNAVLPRKNRFIRPPVANIDQMVIIASAAIPVTDPFLIDRVAAIAGYQNCETIICINKNDLKSGKELFDVYSKAGFKTILTSAETGEGIDELCDTLKGKVSVFTGNSGVGKSSILNRIDPSFGIEVGEVSRKLGRGRHTTRHIELYKTADGAIIGDTPGFSSFDTDEMGTILKDSLQYAFREFEPYLGKCRFQDCSHIKAKGCCIMEAVDKGLISESRYESYVKLYEQAKNIKEWEVKKKISEKNGDI